MPLKKRILDQFIYLNYVREDIHDFNRLKRELENMLSVVAGDRDVVIDFTGCSGISSSEIGLLVRLINHFKKTARFVRIVGSDKITATLKTTNIHTLPNFMIYESQKAFLDEIKKLKNN